MFSDHNKSKEVKENMKRFSWMLGLLFVVIMMAPAMAAPLFGDVPEQHWARDAVMDLAQKGILEGYPDGTFKGDRAATRWEMAMVAQRLLAKSEQMWATFATKADLEALRNLVNALRDELDALGVRVKNLEEKTAELDRRVTELERITFFGDIVSKIVVNSIGTGASSVSNPIWAGQVGNAFTATNGSFPFPGIGRVAGVSAWFPGTYDLTTGRPLINGTGFSTVLNLGIKIKVSSEVDAGAKISAYTSTGDVLTDAFWGVNAPYLSNPFTMSNLGGANGSNNAPWTRATLDKFWIHYKPSNLKLVVGSIEMSNFDKMVLVGPVNPNIDGGYLPFYGFKVTGQTHLISDLQYEVMHSKLPTDYTTSLPWLFGMNFDWKITDRGNFKINFFKANEEPVTYGIRPPTGIERNPGSWINWTQTGAVLPITIANINAAPTAVGNIGPQAVSIIGASFNYKFAGDLWRVALEGAGSTYTPNINSSYTVSGSVFRFGIGYTNSPGTLDLDLNYISVSPFYDPFILPYPGYLTTGVALQTWPNWNTYHGYYQLHDTDKYPNNRQGMKFDAEYRFSGGDGKIFLNYRGYSQVSNSYGQQFGGVGNQPGFIDPVFPVTVGFPVAENKNGTVSGITFGVGYKFSPSPLRADIKYDAYNYGRTSNFNIAANNINLTYTGLKVGLAYPFNDKFAVRAGYDTATISGSFQSNLTNISSTMTAPYVGFDYDISKNTKWSFDVRSFGMADSGNRLLGPDSFGGMQLTSQLKVSF